MEIKNANWSKWNQFRRSKFVKFWLLKFFFKLWRFFLTWLYWNKAGNLIYNSGNFQVKRSFQKFRIFFKSQKKTWKRWNLAYNSLDCRRTRLRRGGKLNATGWYAWVPRHLRKSGKIINVRLKPFLKRKATYRGVQLTRTMLIRKRSADPHSFSAKKWNHF